MASLKKAMAWDEEVFGREYDLDLFMIVAVSDFNFGAMENKGLNIFNTKYILAKPETATDADYLGVEGVVAHEYFHNWTGNRITCRDWFQLSLKEGLTVFRDQEFSSDMNSRAVKRISDVRRLRAAQFPEDAGPTAHPVRPDSYIAIDNFYTPTVYEKGAEVIRMLKRLIGDEAFAELGVVHLLYGDAGIDGLHGGGGGGLTENHEHGLHADGPVRHVRGGEAHGDEEVRALGLTRHDAAIAHGIGMRHLDLDAALGLHLAVNDHA